MSLSINTNRGATIALQSFNRTNRELDAVQKRVSTGYKVADAKDDGASFAIAQGLRGTVKAYGALDERMHEGLRILDTAHAAMKQLSSNLGEMKGLLVKMADASLDAASFATYKQDYSNYIQEIIRIDAASQVNGIGLVGSPGAYRVFVSGIDGGFNVISGLYVGNPVHYGPIYTVNTTADAQAMLTPGGAFDVYEQRMGLSLTTIGGFLRTYHKQMDFNNIISQTISDAIGFKVDADLAKDSARLQALQIRQQLGTQSLSIANQAPKAILSLFQ